MPQKEFIGFNSITNLKDILKKHNPKKIFLVTGKNSYKSSGAEKIMAEVLKHYTYVHFNNFEENPKLSDIEKGIKVFNENNCDFGIAIGGGSAIDFAKSVNLIAANEGNAEDYLKNKKIIENKSKILVAIPTTAGTGSEATKFAVVYIKKTKYSLEHEFIMPDYAIVDPELTMSMPKKIAACSGMDALSQSIESYWSINSTAKSKKYAEKAIRLIVKYFVKAVNNPTKKSRASMVIAANLSGKAINITKTTACHSISYPITSYFNVPHGHAVALTLAPILLYNSEVTEEDLLDKRGTVYVKKTLKEISSFLGAKNVKEGASKINGLMKKIGLSTKLSKLGIKTDKDIDIIIKNGFDPSRVKNNPKLLTKYALKKILEGIR